MRVYELMNILNNMPAGAEIKIRLLKPFEKIILYDEDKECPENSVYEICSDLIGAYKDHASQCVIIE